jgi:predicted ArsR family transcriptional regulator
MPALELDPQLDLFSDARPLPPYVRGSETSREAAESLSERALNRQQGTILAFLRDRGTEGATADEIEAHLPLIGDAIRPRLLELLAYGRVRRTTEKRPTRKGRAAFVWVAREE